MDTLKDQSMLQTEYISRYSMFPYYYHTLDHKYVTGLENQLADNIPYVTVQIKPYMTLDYLSNYYYGRPDYYWVIADFNQIQDAFEDITKYKTLKIPSIAGIEYKGSMRQ